jgi:hypothetical protein
MPRWFAWHATWNNSNVQGTAGLAVQAAAVWLAAIAPTCKAKYIVAEGYSQCSVSAEQLHDYFFNAQLLPEVAVY